MLPPVTDQDILRQSSAFRLTETDNRVYLQHTGTGAKVETDEIGKQILELLPTSPGKIMETFKTGSLSLYVSPKLIGYYLLLFREAGILETQGDHRAGPGNENTGERGSKKRGGCTDGVNAAISVVIITFNGEKFIGKNLESLYNQTLPPQEIIIVDNASTDQTIRTVEEDYKDKGIKIIRNKKNYHYAKAVNTGVNAAGGDLVIILNQDIRLKEDFIEKLFLRYEAEETKETAAGVVPQMRFSKLPFFINGIGNFVTEKNWGSDNYFCAVDIGQFDKLSYVGSACFGAIMVTKQAWKKVGPLDKTYKSFYEDVDWSIRVHFKGLKFLAAPEAIVYHEFGGSYPSGLKLTLVAKNRMRFALKNLKGKLMKTFFKKYFKQDIKNSISFIRRKSYKNLYYYLRAYLGILREIPGIFLQKRKNKTDIDTSREFFTKGAPYVVLANKELEPVIDRHVIRSYYYFTGIENFQFPTDPIVTG